MKSTFTWKGRVGAFSDQRRPCGKLSRSPIFENLVPPITMARICLIAARPMAETVRSLQRFYSLHRTSKAGLATGHAYCAIKVRERDSAAILGTGARLKHARESWRHYDHLRE